MMSRIILFSNSILNSIFPTRCSHCNSLVDDFSTPYLCSSCWNDFSFIEGPACARCGRLFESEETLRHSPEHICGVCRLHPPHFDQAFAVGYFEGSLREAIHQYKYRPCRALGKPLGKWMAQHIRLLANVDVLIPVPLYVMRLKKRGFNQSLLLVYEIHKAFEIPFSYDNLLRIRPTRAQIELSGEERVKNVAGAFDLRYPGRIAEKNVVLIDDVFTSGATMNECSRVLKKAGASQVIACTLARAF